SCGRSTLHKLVFSAAHVVKCCVSRMLAPELLLGKCSLDRTAVQSRAQTSSVSLFHQILTCESATDHILGRFTLWARPSSSKANMKYQPISVWYQRSPNRADPACE